MPSTSSRLIRMVGLGAICAMFAVAGAALAQSRATLTHTRGTAAEPAPPTNTGASREAEPQGPPGQYHTDLLQQALRNNAYRLVLHTGPRMQLAVMSIPPASSIGAESHARVEQMLVVVSGTGEARIHGTSFPLHAGDVVIAAPGTEHDIVNTGVDALKLYTVYTPPNHLPGTLHRTRADAQADRADEQFGEHVR